MWQENLLSKLTDLYLSPPKSWHNNSFLGSVCEQDTEIVPKLISDDILLKYMFVHPFWLHWLESSLFYSNYLISCSAAFHSDFKWLKLARNKFTKCDSRSFNELFLQIYIAWATYPTLSNCWSRNYDPSISRIFRVEYLAGFWQLAQLCLLLPVTSLFGSRVATLPRLLSLALWWQRLSIYRVEIIFQMLVK